MARRFKQWFDSRAGMKTFFWVLGSLGVIAVGSAITSVFVEDSWPFIIVAWTAFLLAFLLFKVVCIYSAMVSKHTGNVYQVTIPDESLDSIRDILRNR